MQFTPHAELPPHRYGAHVGFPKDPAATTVHTPSALAPRLVAHTSQLPPHPVSQHTPSTQFPDAH